MSLEWASFGDPNKGGASHYGGANSASISVRECDEALQQMRADYQADLAKGLSPDDAFKDVTIGDSPLHAHEQGGVSGADLGVLMAGERGGAAVTALQAELQRLGYTDTTGKPLGVDGHFGVSTQRAVEALQLEHRLSVDGEVGPQTRGAIERALREQDVRHLQTTLNTLGYTDALGHPLNVDGKVDPDMRHAVAAFQREQHLTVDGRVGPRTQAALDHAVKASGILERTEGVLPISSPKSPDHALYQQALAGVQKIDADMGRASDQLSRNLAAALAAAAKAQGLTRIDSVAISEDGARTFAAQNGSGFRRYADVTTAQAVQMPIESSNAAATRSAAPPAQTPLPAHALTPQTQGRAPGATLPT